MIGEERPEPHRRPRGHQRARAVRPAEDRAHFSAVPGPVTTGAGVTDMPLTTLSEQLGSSERGLSTAEPRRRWRKVVKRRLRRRLMA